MVHYEEMEVVDLTQTFGGNMPVYPGDPHAHITQIADIESNGFIDHELKTGLHVGTHMDAPMHMVRGGKRISDFPVQTFIAPAHLIDARKYASVPAQLLDDVSVRPGDILLIFTGHAEKFRAPEYYEKFPVVSEEFARRAVEIGVSIIGMDTPSPDTPPFPVHGILLGNEVLIIENLVNLELLLGVSHCTVIGLPMKLQADAAPVRTIALVE